MQAQRFEQFTLAIDHLHKSVKQLKSYFASTLGVKGVHAFWLYILLSHPEGLTSAELASRGMICRSLVSREIEELETKGIVQVADGGKRGYNSRICLTEKGRETAGRIATIALSVQEAADNGISPEELETFYATLDKLCLNFQNISRAFPKES